MIAQTNLKVKLAISLFFVFLAFTGTVHAKIIYVDDDATGANNGSSWADAFNYLQDGLAAAASSDEIRVAQGTYKPDQGAGITPGDRTATFQLKSGVVINGGYAGFGAPNPNARNVGLYETILDGDLKDDDAQTDDIMDLAYDPTRSDNSYHVVVAGNTNSSAVLDGVTISSGHANGTYAQKTCYGGGIYNDSGNPTITDCTFKRNTSISGGAGMCNRSGDPTLKNCTFEQNVCYDSGGGMYNYKADPTITECRFIANLITVNSGGGVYNNRSNPTMTHCIFNGNIARWGHGGAMGNFYINNIKLINCIFSGNSAYYGGGAINGMTGNYEGNTLTLINCTLTENTVESSSDRGGGIFGSIYSLKLNNCILWGNSDHDGTIETSQISLYNGSSVIEYCCVQGWTGTLDPDGQGNISDDPNLIDPAGADNIVGTEDDNLRFSAGSYCIDAGTNSTDPPLPAEDLDGKTRIQNGTVDMGAYEGASAGFILSTAYFAVPEGDSSTFTVALTEDPGGEITVTIAKVSGDSDITVSTSSLDFNSSNYSAPKSVTIDAADDSDYLNGNALISVSATGFFTSSVTAAEADDDNVPSILHVDYRAQGNNSGADWGNAFTDLQDALNVASEYSEVAQIKVSKGTYKPAPPSGSCFESFVLVSGVIVRGGYGGLGQPLPNVRDFDAYETVLSGDLKGDDVGGISSTSWDENSRHVLIGSYTDANTVLDGFTIKHGNAAGKSHDSGGGVYNSGGDLTVINCRFIENFASHIGGGMNNYVSSPTLINCEFISNSATEQGGGIHSGSLTLTNCKFTDNSAEYGGGISALDMTLSDCEFTDNEADYGGAVSVLDRSSATLNSCKFNGNHADYDGGAMWNWDAGTGMTMTNCIFVANSTYGYGGAIYNCYSSPALKHCTFTENSSGWSGSGHAIASEGSDYGPVLTGCILWDGGYEICDSTAYGTTITYSDVQGGWPGGNINAYPCFVREPYDGGDGWGYGDNDDYGDLRLLPDSPCIDAGDPDYIAEPDETDLDGNPRVMAGRIDMGAYESPLHAEARIIPHTINLASKGNWITCYIWLPEGYDVADIESNTVLLDGRIKAESVLPDERQQVATARFNREDVHAILDIGRVELTITGRLTDGTIFEATDVIRVVGKAGKN